ncbi:MAG TPA: hypothetical protein VF941_12600 [Clostridia bacterium]
MKKIILILLTIALLALTATACGSKIADDGKAGAAGEVLSDNSTGNKADKAGAAAKAQSGKATGNKAAETPKPTPNPDLTELNKAKAGKLEPAQMQKLLLLLEGRWYETDNIEAIRELGLTRWLGIEKKGNQYDICRSFSDTGVSGKVLSVNKLEGSNKYRIKGLGDNTGVPMEYNITLNDDGKSLQLTSKLYSEGITDENVKLVKATKELYEQIALKCLSGAYKDIKDRTYEFKESGVAVWPDKTFKFSIDKGVAKDSAANDATRHENVRDEGVAYNLVEYDANGREVARYPFEIVRNKLFIRASKGEGMLFDLRRTGSNDLEQKAIDMVVDKIGAVFKYQSDGAGALCYKSSLGEVLITFDNIDTQGRYHVHVGVEKFADGTPNSDLTTGGKEYAVNIKTGNIEEVKPAK